MPAAALAGAMRCFLEEVEQHPCLASNWVCFMGLSDEQYDHLADKSDELWEQGVREGQWPDDWDRQRDFAAHHVASRIKLTAEQTNAVKDYRVRLKAAIERLCSS